MNRPPLFNKLLQVRLLSCILLAAIMALPGAAQSEHPVTGRKIPGIMSAAGADWLTRSEREMDENPEAAITAMGVRKGMTVADVGAGVGYFSIRIARRVGPTGRVYAEDIQPEMITLLKSNAAREKLSNIIPVLGMEADPKLPDNSIDLVLMVDVYHELSQPQEMLQKIRQALKPDGRLVLVEYRKEDPNIPINPEHKMSVADVKAEVEPEGFIMDKLVRDLPRQHVIIFRKNTM